VMSELRLEIIHPNTPEVTILWPSIVVHRTTSCGKQVLKTSQWLLKNSCPVAWLFLLGKGSIMCSWRILPTVVTEIL
jgi:hypothetical protein